MRILFASYSEKLQTVFQTCVPLAWALRTAGHEVRIASQPELTGLITRAGLTAVPVGRDHNLWRTQERLLRNLAARHPKIYAEQVRTGRMPPFDRADEPAANTTPEELVAGYRWTVSSWYRTVNQPMIAELVEFCRAWRPDLVIWEPGTYAAPIAAKACGAAHARLLWCLDFFGRTRERFLRLHGQCAGQDREDPLGRWLAEQASTYGVEFAEDLTTGHFTLEQLPAALRMDTGLHCVPMRYVPYNGPAVVPRWLREPPSKPRVVLTLGVAMAERFGGHGWSLQSLFDELADLDIELVATLPDSERAKLARIPDNARIIPFAPLHALVPGCSVVVHHAGFGTLATAALHGVPQLTVPEQFDAPPLASRLAATGASLSIPGAEVNGPALRKAVSRLLDEPSFSASARRLREEMLAMPSPNELAGDLERLTTRYRALA
ncbi:activator-dependent family glycosyltransferase [Amycolatopsis sp. YIM 10]|uniref:activator-dependent family glycosyltransferase n=1 Tax=Amycolatopsis sp. YIM 10 TaxID=2653857 RepID=UPI0012900DF9|nr:activator-dependent family glycosyltransferase [Amycolatopsis sp. YIM 10]QFU89735.1 Desosaminyl transferase EryCIII precursor [Amycolatopsis sp. YIM 10]